MRRRRARLSPGIFKTPTGFRVFVRVPDKHAKNGRLVSKRFPADAPLLAMKQWREDTRAEARRAPIDPEPIPTGFAADARVYLETVKAMPSIADRRLHIHDWMAVFGERPRKDITSAMIRAHRDRMLTTGPKRVRRKVKGVYQTVLVAEPLSPGSVNRRLRALENLWTVLDGPQAPNPVRDVPECDEPPALARGSSFAVIQELLSYMPERTRPTKGVKRSWVGPSKTRARIAVELWTGLAHSQLEKLTPADVNFDTMTYFRPRRAKGRRGQRNRTAHGERPRPLLPQAAAAIRHLFAIGAGGKFSRSSLHKTFRRALRAANATRIRVHRQARRKGAPELIPASLRPYDVKHTFGSEAYLASRDLRAVQELLGHSRIELTERYALAAIAPAALAAAGLLAERADKSGETFKPSLPPVGRRRKHA